MLRQAPRRLGTFCLLLGGGQAAAALLWGAALLLVPDRVGELVLGDVWNSASELIVPVTLGVAGAGLGTGAAAGLRALAAARRSLRCQLFASACYVDRRARRRGPGRHRRLGLGRRRRDRLRVGRLVAAAAVRPARAPPEPPSPK